MTWNEISKWAKSHEYKISRKNGSVIWAKNDNPEIHGSEPDLDNAAKAIFNHMTNNKWLEYQKNYRPKD